MRHVRQYPDPVLRRQCVDVVDFDDELRALAERMYSIMDDAWGVGLAAPQLGLLLNIFTYRVSELDEPAAMVNPKIEWSSDETDIDDEGCLSLGELRVSVSRAVSIKVTGHDLFGEPVAHDLEGFAARVFQHEIDHLAGVLAFDRAIDDQSRAAALGYLRPKP
ncbi:MAG: peptide deformylase [Thermoleophilia bacterium]|nr:peptide deformylase [Thermoleophilia bacterium]